MKNHHNIEKSAFRPRTYIGYANSDGGLFYISKENGYWRATRRYCPGEQGVFIGLKTRETCFHEKTLAAVSDMLSRI